MPRVRARGEPRMATITLMDGDFGSGVTASVTTSTQVKIAWTASSPVPTGGYDIGRSTAIFADMRLFASRRVEFTTYFRLSVAVISLNTL